MPPLKTEIMANTPAQVRAYLREALDVLEELDPPEDLRELVFGHAVSLTSTKQLLFEQPQPLDLRLMRRDGV